jgi:hypothetical protein
LRAEFVVPHAQDRSFFYGVNFEFSYNARYWERTRYSGEIRPIIGGRVGPVDLIVNPILDTSFQGLGSLEFAPAARVAYNSSETWAARVEMAQATVVRIVLKRHSTDTADALRGAGLQKRSGKR